MGLDDALIFTRVVDCHSFTQAASSLGMQKSTVSRRIAQLEERLGVRLLNRTTRRLRLTEVGQAYYERCRQIMLDFAEAEQAVMQLQQAPAGLLRITAPIEFGQWVLGRVMGDFMRRHPDIVAEVELASRAVDLLEEGWTSPSSSASRKIPRWWHENCSKPGGGSVPARHISALMVYRPGPRTWSAIAPLDCRAIRCATGRSSSRRSPAVAC